LLESQLSRRSLVVLQTFNQSALRAKRERAKVHLAQGKKVFYAKNAVIQPDI